MHLQCKRLKMNSLFVTEQVCAYLQHIDRPVSNGQPFSLSLQIKRIKSCEKSQTLCEMTSRCRMGCKSGPKGSGGPGALLWELSLGRWVTTQAGFCCLFAQVQSRHPGLERGSQTAGLRVLTRNIPVDTQLQEC